MVYMYMKEPTEEFDWMNVTFPIGMSLVISVAGTLVLGIVPSYILQIAQNAVRLI
jgi:NADH-quinone oxidoreductase subunit N